MSKWRPIETAPKDGQSILYSGTTVSGPRYVYAGRWIEGEGWYETNTHPSDPWGQEDDPTHWMPLPEPPKIEELKNG